MGGNGHENNKLQGDMGRHVPPMYSSTQEYYCMFRHVVAGSFAGKQTHRFKRANRRLQRGHRRNTPKAMEHTGERRVWKESLARGDAATYPPRDPPTPPHLPPPSGFEPIM